MSKKTDVVAAIQSALAIAQALPDDTSPIPAPMLIATYAPATVRVGELTLLTWSSQNATSVTHNGNPVALSGTVTIEGVANLTSTFIATGPGGTVTAQARLEVTPIGSKPTLTAFYAPATIKEGETAQLTWNSTGATSVTRNGSATTLSGTATVVGSTNLSTDFIANGPGGTAQAEARLTVIPAAPLPSGMGLKVALGESYYARRWNWMADYIDLAKLPAPVPFNCWHNAAENVLAPSQHGATSVLYLKLPVWGNGGALYYTTPIVQNDEIVPFNPYSGDMNFSDDVLFTDGRIIDVKGERGKCMVSPYVTWKGHRQKRDDGTINPRMPLYLGVRLDGEVLMLLTNTPKQTYERLGKVEGIRGCFDWSLFLPNTATFLVADHDRDGNGRIIWVDRAPAIAVRPLGEMEDSRLWKQHVIYSGSEVTGVVALDDGTVYAALRNANRIIKIVLDQTNFTAKSIETFLVTPRPFAVEFTSDGRLVVMDEQSRVYVCDMVARTLGPNLTEQSATGGAIIFGTLSVDREGHFGEKNQIVMIRSHGPANIDMFFYSGPNWSKCRNQGGIPWGGSNRPCGDTGFTNDLPGHYPWIGAFHPEQALLLVQGFANSHPMVICPKRPNDPPREAWNHMVAGHGLAVLLAGTVAGYEGTRPSFTCQMDPYGWSGLGTTADYIMEMSKPDGSPDFAAMVAYIQRGMHGSFPRPEIKGYSLYALLYFLAGCSQRLIREGQPLLDKLYAAIPGSGAGQTPAPQIIYSSDFGRVFIAAQIKAGKLVVVSYSISGDTAHDPALRVRVLVDEGLLSQYEVGEANAANNWTLPMPAVAAGEHAITCKLLSAPPSHSPEATKWVVVNT